MAEEEKKESCKYSESLKTVGKVLIGVILIIIGAYLCLRWWWPLRALIQGCLGPFLILVGLVFIAIAKE